MHDSGRLAGRTAQIGGIATGCGKHDDAQIRSFRQQLKILLNDLLGSLQQLMFF